MRYDKKENTILLRFKGLSNSPIFQYLNFSFHRHFKMSFFATCVYLRGNLRVRLATQRKSQRKLNLRPLATIYRSV